MCKYKGHFKTAPDLKNSINNLQLALHTAFLMPLIWRFQRGGEDVDGQAVHNPQRQTDIN